MGSSCTQKTGSNGIHSSYSAHFEFSEELYKFVKLCFIQSSISKATMRNTNEIPTRRSSLLIKAPPLPALDTTDPWVRREHRKGTNSKTEDSNHASHNSSLIPMTRRPPSFMHQFGWKGHSRSTSVDELRTATKTETKKHRHRNSDFISRNTFSDSIESQESSDTALLYTPPAQFSQIDSVRASESVNSLQSGSDRLAVVTDSSFNSLNFLSSLSLSPTTKDPEDGPGDLLQFMDDLYRTEFWDVAIPNHELFTNSAVAESLRKSAQEEIHRQLEECRQRKDSKWNLLRPKV